MKPEFSEILIPSGKLHSESSSTIHHHVTSGSGVNSSIIKWLLVTTLLFTLVVTIVTTGFIVRYEDKMVQYEERIFNLEHELDSFFKNLEEHGQAALIPDEEFEYETHSHSDLFDDSDDLEELIDSPELEVHHEDKSSEPFGVREIKLQVQESRTRNKRQIPFPNVPTFGPDVERTNEGVPIVDRSYLSSAGVTLTPRYFSDPNPTTDSEGLRLYEGLVETGGRNEPKSLDFAERQGLNAILPHHQVSAAWSEKNEGRRPRLELKSGDSALFTSGVSATSGPQFANELTYTRSASSRRSSSLSGTGYTQAGNSGGNSNAFIASGNPTNGATFHRNSRVPATGDYFYPKSGQTQTRSIQYPPLRKLSVGDGEGEVIARVLQSENEADTDGPNQAIASANYGQTATAEASSTRTRTSGYRRNQQNPSTATTSGSTSTRASRREGQKYHRKPSAFDEDDSGEVSIVKAEAWVEGPKAIAAHYVADVSNYTTAHRHYDGNGRLRNADGIFAAWRPAEWMTADGGSGSKNFVLNSNGVLTVKKTGMYYIYAQIHYLDEHDINGFTVQVNTDPFLQCTTMTETYNAGTKSNSCFTAGVTYLKENDRILIKDIETNRYSIFKPEKSFFGLMKMGESTH